MPTYAQLSDVKKILKRADRKVILFSDNAINRVTLERDGVPTHKVGFKPEEVSIDAGFDNRFELMFDFTSSSNFDVYKAGDIVENKSLLDSGQDKTSDYTTPSGNITVKSGAWVGSFTSNDFVTVEFRPNMSDEDAKSYIEDAEIAIDADLMSFPVDFLEDGDDRLFNSSDGRPVPNEIGVATAYLAAFLIYTDSLASVHKEKNKPSYTSRWKRRAKDLVDKYMSRKGYSPPTSKTYPRKIDQVGIEDLESGSEKLGDLDDGSGSKNIFSDEMEPE